MKPRISINRFMAPDLPIEQLLKWCRDNDVQGIGITLDDVEAQGVSRLQDLLGEYGIHLTGVGACLDSASVEMSGKVRLTDRFLEALRVASMMDVPLTVTTGGPTFDVSLMQWRHHRVSVASALSLAARSSGVSLRIEPLAPQDVSHSGLVGLDMADELMEMPQIEVLLDTWHVWWDERVWGFIERYAPTLTLIHVADYLPGPSRAVPGEGLSDLQALTGRLLKHSFRGWWEVEVLISDRLTTSDSLRHLDSSLAGTRRLIERG